MQGIRMLGGAVPHFHTDRAVPSAGGSAGWRRACFRRDEPPRWKQPGKDAYECRPRPKQRSPPTGGRPYRPGVRRVHGDGGGSNARMAVRPGVDGRGAGGLAGAVGPGPDRCPGLAAGRRAARGRLARRTLVPPNHRFQLMTLSSPTFDWRKRRTGTVTVMRSLSPRLLAPSTTMRAVAGASSGGVPDVPVAPGRNARVRLE